MNLAFARRLVAGGGLVALIGCATSAPEDRADADTSANGNGDTSGDGGALPAPGDVPAPPRVRGPSTTIAIDATKVGYAIPATYVGLSVSRANIGGAGGYERLFDPAHDPFYAHLANLVHEIGVKHLRTVSSQAAATDPDPTPAEDDAFFQFAHDAGLGEKSIIYSLHLFDEANGVANTSNPTAATHIWTTEADRALLESFALDNEPDWKFHYRPPYLDSNITGYDTPVGGGYRDTWTERYTDIQASLGSPNPPAAFSGPDTGSNYPVSTDTASTTSIDGVPFTLRFAIDQQPRIGLATQHFYGGSNTQAPVWQPGSYALGDVVQDPKNANLTYQAIRDNPQSNNHPAAAPAYWTAFPPLWTSGASYAVGDEVQDPVKATVYKCTVAEPKSIAAPSANASWTADDGVGLLGARQMASAMLSPSRSATFATLLGNALAGAPTWPAGLGFRLTEANAYSGGRDRAFQIFATALWSLDFFHWWAARGCSGVDPFTRVAQYNAPIFQDATGDFVAEPYAYGMLAFAQGSHGKTIAPDAIALSAPAPALTTYAVVDATDLYVTLINASFDAVGSTDTPVTIAAPAGFTPGHARVLVLASAPGASGNATTPSATLGGATIPTTGPWAGTWQDVAVNDDGSVGPLTVLATTAVVVDLTAR